MAPALPADLFAVAGYLFEASGAYQYIVAPFNPAKGQTKSHVYRGPTQAPSSRRVKAWCDIGARWARDFSVSQDEIQPIWAKLLLHADERLVVNPRKKSEVPAWWGLVHSLLVIADEASVDVGYQPLTGGPDGARRWANFLTSRHLHRKTAIKLIVPLEPSGEGDVSHRSRHVSLDSVCGFADREVVRVLPKSRTATQGCTLRTFSHNLALLPAHGRANAYWHQPRTSNADPDKKRLDLNLLLVPFPYKASKDSISASTGLNDKWGRFSLRQTWLTQNGQLGSTKESRRHLVRFVEALIDQAGDVPVHGVVFPDYALDWPTYDALARHLCEFRPDVEILIGGVSSDCNGRKGNQIAVSSMFFDEAKGRSVIETHSRRKHHRWLLEASQIDNYGLPLDRDYEYWEHLDVEERVVHVDVFRASSTITAVFCEDLARMDPALSLLRTVGPNLLIGLSMDGPQLKWRWPGVYATGLADDPGSSVLTLTSCAMVNWSEHARSSQNKPTAGNVVALWKNHAAAPRGGNGFCQLELAKGEHAILLSLKGSRATETTIDGRKNSDAISWSFGDQKPLAVPDAEIQDWGWIVC